MKRDSHLARTPLQSALGVAAASRAARRVRQPYPLKSGLRLPSLQPMRGTTRPSNCVGVDVMAGEAKEEFPPLLQLGFHPMSIADIRKLCVSPFPRSATRREIMSGLETVIGRLQTSKLSLQVWVNGSFLTQKLDPDDSDIAVKFFGPEVDSATQEQIDVLNWAASPSPKLDYKCHCFPFPEFPEGHDLYDVGQWRRAYWLRQFGFSRQDEPKGLAVINLPLGVA